MGRGDYSGALFLFTGAAAFAGTLFNVAFFTAHFGGFSWGHLTALNHMLGVKDVFAYFTESPLFWIAVISLLISHLFSFGYNFLRRREFLQRSSIEQMFMPYKRVVVMHLIVLFGGIFLIRFENPTALLIILVIIKIALDIWAHFKSHKPRIVT